MLALLLTAALQTAPAAAPAPPIRAPAPEEAWRLWRDERAVTTPAPCLRHAELVTHLDSLAARFPGDLTVDEVGRSYEGRSIHLLTLGEGERKVLLWSQMHGDEPSATPALLDLASYLLTHRAEPLPAMILSELTLLMVPMLNPDGSESYERRNAQWIDVNRDALNLATPEGRLLKRLRDEHEPVLGFNLHDQNRRTAVGETGVLATNAVLAVAGDPEGTVTPGRMRAKRACAAIVAALAPLVPGGMARYDEDWSPRAFGDNLTAWGTPVVLIESGGPPAGRSLTDLTGLNFVALLSVLTDLARDDLAGHDPELYERLERNQRGVWTDVVIRGGRIWRPGLEPFRADLAFDRARSDRADSGCRLPSDRDGSRVAEIGDARFLAAAREVDATGGAIMAPLDVGIKGWWRWRHRLHEALPVLARHGVGRVFWTVPPRYLHRARTRAESQAGPPGRPRVIALAPGAGRSPLYAAETPSGPPPLALAEVLAGFGAAAELPADLWRWGGSELRPGRPASFLLLSPPEGEELTVENAIIEGIWLDGVEIER